MGMESAGPGPETGADEVIVDAELFERFRSNSSEEFDLDDPYLGYGWLLVRTALVRAKGLEPYQFPRVEGRYDMGVIAQSLQQVPPVAYVLSFNAALTVVGLREVGRGEREVFDLNRLARELYQTVIMTGGSQAVIVMVGGDELLGSGFTRMSRTVSLIKRLHKKVGCTAVTLLDVIVTTSEGYFSLPEEDWTSWASLKYTGAGKETRLR